MSEPGIDQPGEHKPKRRLSPLFQQLLKLKVWLVERFRIGERQLMLFWAALIGLLGALAAEIFRRIHCAGGSGALASRASCGVFGGSLFRHRLSAAGR